MQSAALTQEPLELRLERIKRLGNLRLDNPQCRYLNNIVEQDHRTVKRRARLAMGYRSFGTAWKTVQGIEAMHMISKGRVRWLAKDDAVGQVKFIHKLFGVTA